MSRPALIVVDVQRALDDPGYGERGNPDAETHIAEALAGWRERGAPVIHIRHESAGLFEPGAPTTAFKPEAEPLDGEPVITKNVNNAFVGTDLEERLRAAGIDTVAIVGLTTDHCVSTTARMASDLGFATWLLHDATAAHPRRTHDGELIDADSIQRSELASLQDEFADVIATSDALERLGS